MKSTWQLAYNFFNKHIHYIAMFSWVSAIISFYFLSPFFKSENQRILSQLITLSFIFLVEYIAILLTVRNLNPKHNLYLEIILTSIFVIIFSVELLDVWSYNLNYIFRYFTPERVTNVIFGEGNQQIWPFPIIAINLVVMYIRFKISVKKGIVKAIGLKRIILDSLAIYGTLVFLLWIQTHFSYVNAFFGYMTTEARLVHSLVESNKSNPNYLKSINVLYTENIDEIVKDISERNKNESLTQQKNVKELFLEPIPKFLGNSHSSHPKSSWENMLNFEDWVSFLNNSDRMYVTKDLFVINKIIFIDNKKHIRQGLMYINKYNNGYYYYYNLSLGFKTNNINYIYTTSFLLFNFLLISCLFYLYFYHKKNVFIKEKSEL